MRDNTAAADMAKKKKKQGLLTETKTQESSPDQWLPTLKDYEDAMELYNGSVFEAVGSFSTLLDSSVRGEQGSHMQLSVTCRSYDTEHYFELLDTMHVTLVLRSHVQSPQRHDMDYFSTVLKIKSLTFLKW